MQNVLLKTQLVLNSYSAEMNLIGQLLNDTTPKNAKRDFIKLTHNFAKMNTKDDSACKSLLDHKSYFVRLHNLNYSNDIIHTISK